MDVKEHHVGYLSHGGLIKAQLAEEMLKESRQRSKLKLKEKEIDVDIYKLSDGVNVDEFISYLQSRQTSDENVDVTQNGNDQRLLDQKIDNDIVSISTNDSDDSNAIGDEANSDNSNAKRVYPLPCNCVNVGLDPRYGISLRGAPVFKKKNI